MFARFALVVCSLGLFGLVGCGPAKLDESKTFSLEAGDVKPLELTAQSKPQKITVEYKSSAGEVAVYVFKMSETGALDNPEKNKDKALAAKKSAGETFSVEVPANTAVQVLFSATKKTEVTTRLTNK